MIGVKGIALCLAKGQQSSRAGGLPVLSLTGAPPPPPSLDSEGISVDANGGGGGREVSISQICPFYS